MRSAGGLFALSLACMFLIGPMPRTADRGSSIPGTRWSTACATSADNKLVLGAISLDLFAVLLGGATAMLPVFARDILHAGPDRARPSARRAGGRRDADRDLSSRSGR